MLMNAVKSFYHEESVPKEDVEMLQIFIRPEKSNMQPNVQFMKRDNKIINK